MVYGKLRTGLTFAEVKAMLWSADSDPSTWRYRRRNTVLGKWHQIKREYWDCHVSTCGKADETSAA
jgi:hypothetical protein